MVLELIILTAAAEIILIRGLAIWFEYSDMIESLKGGNK